MLKGLILTFISFVINKSGFFIISLMSANMMTQRDFAVYSVFFTIMLAFNGTFSQGNFTAANRYFNEQESRLSLLYLGIAVSIISSIICLTYISFWFDSTFRSFDSLIITAIVFLSSIFYLLSGCCYSVDNSEVITKANLINFLVLVLSTQLIGTTGYLAILIGYLLSLIFSLTYLVPNIFKLYYKESYSLDLELIKRMTKKVLLPFLLGSFCFVPVFSHFGATLIQNDGGEYEVALFNVSNQIKMIISFIPLVLTAYFLSKIVEKKITIRFDWNLNLYLSSIITAVLIISSSYIWSAFNIEETVQAKKCLIFMLLSSLLVSLKSTIGRQILAKEMGWFSFLSNSVFTLIFISTVVFTEFSSAIELAFCFFISQLIHFIAFSPIFKYLKVFNFGLVFNFDSLICILLIALSIYFTLVGIEIYIMLLMFAVCFIKLTVLYKYENISK